MKTTAEMIAVMQAFERGEEIQILDGGVWMKSYVSPSWNWSRHDYRVKPREPRVIWVNEYEGNERALFNREQDARLHAGVGVVRTAVKYVEEI